MDAASRRDDLIRRIESALTVRRGRREGEQETRISLDHRLPPFDPSGGRIGLVCDAGIALTTSEITDIGLQRGGMSDGYKGDYYTFPA
jgi:hypothetical protein